MMRLRIKPSSFPSRSKVRPGARVLRARERGYALLILMMAVTVLLVALTAVLPSVYVEGQREREEELIFRANEYSHAIVLFHRKFNRFPTSVKELLQTNRTRFLRHAYKDPMTKGGRWRFIHANANGTILDAQSTQVPGQGPGAEGGLNSAQGASELSSLGGRRGRARGMKLSTDPASKEIKGGFIAGVASRSKKESIRVYKHKKHYDEWEFLGVEDSQAGQFAGAGVTGAQPAAGPTAPANQILPANSGESSATEQPLAGNETEPEPEPEPGEPEPEPDENSMDQQ